MLLKQDSKLRKDDKNMAMLILITQPQNPSLHNIPVNYKFIRAATQNKFSTSLSQMFFFLKKFAI